MTQPPGRTYDEGGSASGILSKEERDVFKTFAEISQMEVIQQAADRQKFIDQGQSLNVMISDEVPKGRQPACHQGLGVGNQDAVLPARGQPSTGSG